jgi:hypothetical protein
MTNRRFPEDNSSEEKPKRPDPEEHKPQITEAANSVDWDSLLKKQERDRKE